MRDTRWENGYVTGYDVIGDIHGCADQLEDLLGTMGYRSTGGAYRHTARQAVFVGDLIDRGPQQLRVLEIVKAMVDEGSAQIVMGNHEFNAICYSIRGADGAYLRRHSDKNTRQHQAFLEQLSDGQRRHYLDWFRTFPLWLDLDGLRVVHACWDEESMKIVEQQLGSNRFGSDEQFVDASVDGHPLFVSAETLVKGPELSLLDHGQRSYLDKDGHERSRARVRWWSEGTSLRELAEMSGTFTTVDGESYPLLPDIELAGRDHVYRGEVPVIYGHYWRSGTPTIGVDWTARTACVDFSAVKGGALTAYRWTGEDVVQEDNFIQLASPQ